MFELLPDDIRKVAQKKYLASLVTVYMFGFCFLFLGSIALLIPSYTFIGFKERAVKLEIDIFDKKTNSVDVNDTSSFIKNAKSKLSVIKSLSQIKPALTSIDLVFDRLPKGVDIKSISFDRGGDDIMGRISVQGIANTRNNLIEFSDALKKESRFSKVDVPVSSFAKNANAEFNIIIEGSF